MSNQLERFQGLSETRWPLPAGVSCSGEDRKALSRYINDYIAELERSDAQISRALTSEPKWASEPAKEPGNSETPRMSRAEYIKRQNALFHELTGHRSWSELSAQQAAQDQRDAPLMNSLELYMAALDEKIYMGADHLRAMVGLRDKEVRDQYDALRRDPPSVRDLVELRDNFELLWFEHSDLSHQRDQLEVEMSQLRYDHALQTAKVVRLQYATHALGRKLVGAQRAGRASAELNDECAALRRENEHLRAENEALRAQDATTRAVLAPDTSASPDPKTRDVEERISALFEATLQLRAAESYAQDEPEPASPLALLERATNLIDLAKADADHRLASIVEAFGTQYRAREQELLVQVATLERHRQILLARCEKLAAENTAHSSDLAYLEQRTLSLVLMLKSVRATLDQTEESRAGDPRAESRVEPPMDSHAESHAVPRVEAPVEPRAVELKTGEPKQPKQPKEPKEPQEALRELSLEASPAAEQPAIDQKEASRVLAERLGDGPPLDEAWAAGIQEMIEKDPSAAWLQELLKPLQDMNKRKKTKRRV